MPIHTRTHQSKSAVLMQAWHKQIGKRSCKVPPRRAIQLDVPRASTSCAILRIASAARQPGLRQRDSGTPRPRTNLEEYLLPKLRSKRGKATQSSPVAKQIADGKGSRRRHHNSLHKLRRQKQLEIWDAFCKGLSSWLNLASLSVNQSINQSTNQSNQ